MDKSIVMEKHLIEAWGVWWVQWQKQVKDTLKKQVMSPQSFVNEHLVNEPSSKLVSSEGECFLRNTTTGPTLLPR